MSTPPELPKCPRGHPIGRKSADGECTPMRCGDTEAERLRQKAHRERKKQQAAETAGAEAKTIEAIERAVTEEEKQDAVETKNILAAARRHEKWLTFLTDKKGLPEFQSLEAAEKWTDAQITSLLPEVALELKRKLKFGSDKDKEYAVDRILSATGRSKKEAATASAPPIVIQVSGGISLPWRSQASDATVDAVTQGSELAPGVKK